MNSIRKKILASILTVVALFAVVCAYLSWSLYLAKETANEIASEQLPLLIAEENLNIVASNLLSTSRGYLLTEGDFKDRFEMHAEEFEIYAEEALQIAQKTRSADLEQLENLITLNREMIEAIRVNVLDVYDADNQELAQKNFHSIGGTAREVIDGYAELVDHQEVMITEKEQRVVAKSESTMVSAITIVIVVIVATVIFTFVLAGKVTKPIQQVREQLKAIGEGKLDEPALKVSSNDEIGDIAREANHMQQQLRTMMSEIKGVSNNMSMHSEELLQTSNEVQSVTEQVAGTMEELASGSESQATHTGEIATAMENFMEKVELANENGKKIQASSQDVIEMTERGYNLMNLSEAQMTNIDAIVKDSVQKVKELDVHYQGISRFVAVIEDIANQTNLLALNASIEAARAGEQGRGFAVVAEEIRKFAEQSAASVTEIIELVGSIQVESEKVTESLSDGYVEVEVGTNRIRETSETFHHIRELMSETVRNIQVVSGNLMDITTNSKEMSNSIQEIASLSEQSSAGIEETSASAQQTMSSMEEITASAEQLVKISEQLNTEVAKFKM